MLSTSSPDEKIIALDHIGTFRTPSGTIKILVITIKITDNAPTTKEENFTEYAERKLEEANTESAQ